MALGGIQETFSVLLNPAVGREPLAEPLDFVAKRRGLRPLDAVVKTKVVEITPLFGEFDQLVVRGQLNLGFTDFNVLVAQKRFDQTHGVGHQLRGPLLSALILFSGQNLNHHLSRLSQYAIGTRQTVPGLFGEIAAPASPEEEPRLLGAPEQVIVALPRDLIAVGSGRLEEQKLFLPEALLFKKPCPFRDVQIVGHTRVVGSKNRRFAIIFFFTPAFYRAGRGGGAPAAQRQF